MGFWGLGCDRRDGQGEERLVVPRVVAKTWCGVSGYGILFLIVLICLYGHAGIAVWSNDCLNFRDEFR